MYFQSNKDEKLLKPFYKPYVTEAHNSSETNAVSETKTEAQKIKNSFKKVNPLAHLPPYRNKNTATGKRRNFSLNLQTTT